MRMIVLIALTFPGIFLIGGIIAVIAIAIDTKKKKEEKK